MAPKREQQPADEKWVDPLLQDSSNLPRAAGIGEDAERAEIERLAQLMLATGCLYEGWLNAAIEAFQAAGVETPKDKLVACGNKYLEEGRLDDALDVFRAVASLQLSEER